MLINTIKMAVSALITTPSRDDDRTTPRAAMCACAGCAWIEWDRSQKWCQIAGTFFAYGTFPEVPGRVLGSKGRKSKTQSSIKSATWPICSCRHGCLSHFDAKLLISNIELLNQLIYVTLYTSLPPRIRALFFLPSDMWKWCIGSERIYFMLLGSDQSSTPEIYCRPEHQTEKRCNFVS